MGAHGLGPSTIVAPGQKIAGLETQSLLSSWASRGNPGVTDAEGQTQALNTQTERGKVTALAHGKTLLQLATAPIPAPLDFFPGS